MGTHLDDREVVEGVIGMGRGGRWCVQEDARGPEGCGSAAEVSGGNTAFASTINGKGFLKPLGLSKYRLAKDIDVPPQRIGDLVAGKRSITADTDLRLCRYFGLSDGWWLRGQAIYDTAVARETMGEALSRISRCQLLVG